MKLSKWSFMKLLKLFSILEICETSYPSLGVPAGANYRIKKSRVKFILPTAKNVQHVWRWKNFFYGIFKSVVLLTYSNIKKIERVKWCLFLFPSVQLANFLRPQVYDFPFAGNICSFRRKRQRNLFFSSY